MCGIAGVLDQATPPAPEQILAMMQRLAHRGPDGSGYYIDDFVALGHTRLAIIDQAGGAQPVCNEDQSLWVTFNGEIFNYLELRDTLMRRGHEFRSASDTEVIVHAWEEWGQSCFEMFNGQWAIGLWDRRKRQLILSRDRMGVRPLFYVQTGTRLVFASEVKALFADSSVPREIDPEGLDEILTFWSSVAPLTPFRGVRQLPPGCLAIIDGNGLSVRRFWQPEFPARGQEPQQDVDANARELRDRLVEACRLRFERSDVPVGAYLSGGIDSSITAAVISQYTNAPLHTFSLRFTDRVYDEGGYQSLMARRLQTDHEDVVVSPQDIAEVFPEVVRHAETPILRAAPAPLFLLSRLVRTSGYKVVVTGEGADEVLAGYDLFREARVRRFWARDPASQLRSRAAELLYPWMSRSPGQTPAFARTFFGRNLDVEDPALSHRPRWDSTSNLRAMLSADARSRHNGADPAERLISAMPTDSGAWDPLSRDQWLEIQTLLPGYILSSQGDRMLMANSVEGRFPFLDRDVVGFANGLPARHKLFGLEEKYLLKRAFADLVPEEILHRPKQPYRAPDASSFFSGSSPDWLHDVTSRTSVEQAGVFEPDVVAKLIEKCRRFSHRPMGNTDNMRALAVISTQLLHAQFIVGDGSGSGMTGVPQPLTVIDRRTREMGAP